MRQPPAALTSWLLLLLFFTAGCPKPQIPTDYVSGQPLALDDPLAAEFVANYRARIDQGRALRGAARVVISRPDFKMNRPQRIAIAYPAKLRFEVLGLFDVLAAMLVSDGESFGFYDASTGEITRGVGTSDLLWDLAGLDLDPEQVVALLLASPAPSPTLVLAGAWRDPDQGITVAYAPFEARGDRSCEGSGDDPSSPGVSTCLASVEDLDAGGEIFRFDAEGLLREMRSLGSGWITRYSATFENYGAAGVSGPSRSTDMRPYPMRITIHSPAAEALARFEWKRVMLADELPDRHFVIPAENGRGG